jgi:RNA polymerase sigma-70 factor (ECF subfamily)
VPESPGLREAFESNRSLLWGLGYRLTGNAADADDIVQDTFVRALERPPARTDQPWTPWLVRVAVNLGRDLLRRRRRRGYAGSWLPSPVDTEAGAPEVRAPDREGPGTRYDVLESVGFAFLLALEALTPTQRAVLLLRDVFDYSAAEAADVLEMSEANVRQSHLRARRVLEGYDRARRVPSRDVQARDRLALERFLTLVAQGDAAGVASLLARDVQATGDGGGDYAAASRPVTGRDKVARFFLGLGQQAGGVPAVAWRTLNGLPALVLDFPAPRPGWAPRVVTQVETDPEGRITHIYSVMASAKLKGMEVPVYLRYGSTDGGTGRSASSA